MRKRVIVLFVALFAVAIIIFTAIKIVDSQKTARLNLLVTPTDATILINGKEYKNGNYRFFPEDVTIQITHAGMQQKDIQIKLEPNTTASITTFLKYDGDNEIYTDAENYRVLKLVNDPEAAAIVDKLKYAARITGILPLRKVTTLKPGLGSEPYIETVIRNATKDEQCTTYVCLRVQTNAEDKVAAAQALLKENGFNIDDYEVMYDD